MPFRSSSKCLGSSVTQKPKRSFSKSLRDVVACIIEVLDVSDTEEKMAKTVDRADQEENFREGKKCFQCWKGMQCFNLIKSFLGDSQGEIKTLLCSRYWR